MSARYGRRKVWIPYAPLSKAAYEGVINPQAKFHGQGSAYNHGSMWHNKVSNLALLLNLVGPCLPFVL